MLKISNFQYKFTPSHDYSIFNFIIYNYRFYIKLLYIINLSYSNMRIEKCYFLSGPTYTQHNKIKVD